MSDTDTPRYSTSTGAQIDPWKRIEKLERELAQARQDGIEEGRRQMQKEAAAVCIAPMEELHLTDDVLAISDYFKGFKAALDSRSRAIQAIPVKKEPTP